MNKIPVTILTGFLGAGKTTLLNKLMVSNTKEKVIVIINEFGETSIDHEFVLANDNERIYQMENGCMCCILRDDLVEMFYNIIEARKANEIEVDRIIIETSGLAEPSPIAQTILRTPMISEVLLVDSIISLVDVENSLHQFRHYNESVEQVAYADLVYLTKTENVDDLKKTTVKDEVHRINPFVEIKELDLTTVEFSDVVGLDLFDRSLSSVASVEKDIDVMLEREESHEHHDHDHDHDHGDHDHDHHHSDIDAFSIVIDEPIDAEKFEVWLNMLIVRYGMDLMRYKGILNIKDEPHQVVLQGVNMAFKTDLGKPWGNDRQTKIVLIGKNLPEDIIRSLLVEHVIDDLIKAHNEKNTHE